MRFVPLPGLLARLRALSQRYGLALPDWHLGLLAVDAPPGKLDELKVQGRVAQSVEGAHDEAQPLRERLAGAQTRAEIVEEIERTGPDTPLYALALADDSKLEEYYGRLRNVRLEVDGDDLAALGLVESPRVGEILAELRRQKLNGKLDGRAEELAAARELVGE